MLFDLMNGKAITHLPHEKDFNLLRQRLSDDEYNSIMEKLNEMIGSSEVHTSSWMPKKDDWDGVFKPIADKAAKGNYELSGMFFGLLVWKVFMDHLGKWSFAKNSREESKIQGTTYFPYKDKNSP